MKKKTKAFLALSASLLGLTALTGCTADDISSLQSQVTALQEELTSLRNELTALKEEMNTNIQAVKDDYGAKIKEVNDKIAACEAKLKELEENLAAAKQELTNKLDSDIADLKKYTDDEINKLKERITKDEEDLAALKAKHDSDLAAAKTDYESKISALSDDMADQKKALEDDYKAKISELDTKYQTECASLKADIATCNSSIESFKTQYETDKKALEDDYNAKIDALQKAYEEKVASIDSQITSLNTQITSLKEEMNTTIQNIQSDYNAKIDALTSRISTIENTDPHNLLTGYGVPDSSLGVNGDSYINLSNWDYYTKADGAWTLSGNMRGGQGDKGDKGDKGDAATTYIPCIFQNYDGTKLYEFYYEKGSTIVYDGPTPTKPSETIDGYAVDWTFSGWDKSLENIQKPTIFTAQFESLRECTFKNYDGTVLYTTTVNFGESVEYKGETPTKPDTTSGEQTLVWTFNGWDKSLDSIKEDTVFTAKFYAPNSIKCTFLNYDGTELYVDYCGEGDRIEYKGETPKKAGSDDNAGTVTSYSFTGWDKSLKNITEDTTFTAQFGETTSYWCTFVNYDNTELYKTLVFKGGQATYVGETPEREQAVTGTTVTDYTWSSWDRALSNISAPTTFIAQYSYTTFTGHKVTFMNGEETIYSHYFKEGTTASYPKEMPFDYDKTNVTLFLGWDKSLKNISADIVTNAQFKTITRKQNGEYPQTKVTDQTLIDSIVAAINSGASTADGQGYIAYDGEKYCLYNGNFYKVEPIKWRFLENGEGTALMVSDVVLDAHRYNEYYDGTKDGYYANNYSNSEIRKWLNEDFFDEAFYYDDSLVATTEVDNSVASTGYFTNQYACGNTNDKVFLLSFADMTNTNYGFDTNKDRMCKATDYAVARNCYINSNGYAYYWTRSPYSGYSDHARGVDLGGDLHRDYVDGSDYGVRPALSLSIS